MVARVADERAAVRKPAVVERRAAAVAAKAHPVGVAPRPIPVASALQQRLGRAGG